MKLWIIALVAVVLVIAGSAGGYWIGLNQHETAAAQAPARKLLYYRNPMGQPDTSLVPKKDSIGALS